MAAGRGGMSGTATRGRGCGRGRGRGSSSTVSSCRNNRSEAIAAKDPTDGWKLSHRDGMPSSVMMEDQWVTACFSERARLYVHAVCQRIETELQAKSLKNDRVGHVVMMVSDLCDYCSKLLNEHIALGQLHQLPVARWEMIAWLAMMTYSHFSGFSYEDCMDFFKCKGLDCLTLDRLRFLTTHMRAFRQQARMPSEPQLTWHTQRDLTSNLDYFERTMTLVSREIFGVLDYAAFTVDDDLIGTRASDNQLKTLSSRKAAKEGHTSIVVAEALFRPAIAVRFKRRNETQSENVDELIKIVTDDGRANAEGLLLIEDRGFGSQAGMEKLCQRGIGGVLITPEHLNNCHPFVAKSRAGQNDKEQEEFEDTPTSDAESDPGIFLDDSDPNGNDDEANVDRGDDADDGNDGVDGNICDDDADDDRRASNTPLDAEAIRRRRRKFTVDDDPYLGPESFVAVRNVKINGKRRSSKMLAIAVRQYGDKSQSKVLRFFASVPKSLTAPNAWVATPAACQDLTNTLFAPQSRPLDELRAMVEGRLRLSCTVLTLGQRCADWFTLRQFMFTGTMVAKFLNTDSTLCAAFCSSAHSPERPLRDWLGDLCQSWFAPSKSTEPMSRGTATEPAILKAACTLTLRGRQPVRTIYECGLVASTALPWLACSPDGIAVLETEPGCDIIFACVEAKTSVSQDAQADRRRLASLELVECELGDEVFRDHVDPSHVGQLVAQFLVTQLGYVLYLCATETGLLFGCLIKENSVLTARAIEVLHSFAPLCSWASSDTGGIPSYASRADAVRLKSRRAFWAVIRHHVLEHGPFPPVKIFRHWIQVLYSKGKGGVDGLTQVRNALTSTAGLKWEQKLAVQCFKTVFINAYLSYRMMACRDLTATPDSFRSIQRFRDALNGVESISSFVYRASQDLLRYAKAISTSVGPMNPPAPAPVSSSSESNQDARQQKEAAKAYKQSKKRPRSMDDRIDSYNDGDLKKLRLNNRVSHDMIPTCKPRATAQWCALCTNRKGGSGGRTMTQCSACKVPLCVRVVTDDKNRTSSCWTLWHKMANLKTRLVAKDHGGSSASSVGRDNVSGADAQASSLPDLQPCSGLNIQPFQEPHDSDDEPDASGRRRSRRLRSSSSC